MCIGDEFLQLHSHFIFDLGKWPQCDEQNLNETKKMPHPQKGQGTERKFVYQRKRDQIFNCEGAEEAVGVSP
jgi:hypothetical protein